MHIPTRRNIQITSRGSWISICLLVAALVLFAYFHSTNRAPNPTWKELPPPTWSGVPDAIGVAVRTRPYESGAKALPSDTALKAEYEYYAVIEFLRSLTPGQVQTLHSRVLFFNQLNESQQRALSQLAQNVGKQGLIERSKESGIFVSDFSPVVNDGTSAFLFNWIVCGKGTCSGMCLSFPSRDQYCFRNRTFFVQ